ncbi:hypothetical protein AGLY_001095 [Aphis glycines]|uniref:Uncharacterized protein n=1 Tax=Aphis glycines TaxID=307491 RepID=A0A6G0UB55_APHGL|nr:hypothetical protein AGLY_001095 [Aphis glycines]
MSQKRNYTLILKHSFRLKPKVLAELFNRTHTLVIVISKYCAEHVPSRDGECNSTTLKHFEQYSIIINNDDSVIKSNLNLNNKIKVAKCFDVGELISKIYFIKNTIRHYELVSSKLPCKQSAFTPLPIYSLLASFFIALLLVLLFNMESLTITNETQYINLVNLFSYLNITGVLAHDLSTIKCLVIIYAIRQDVITFFLSSIYGKPLIEDYNHEYSVKPFFNKISTHFKILKVQKINNPQTYGMYLLQLHNEELELDCDIMQKILQKTILTDEKQSESDLEVVLVFHHVCIKRINMLDLRKPQARSCTLITR